MRRRFIAICVIPAIIVTITTPAFAVTKCPQGSLPYTLKIGDTCSALTRKLNFADPRSIEELNRPISGFQCTKAKRGQIVCYRPAANMTLIPRPDSDLLAQAPFSKRNLNWITEIGEQAPSEQQ